MKRIGRWFAVAHSSAIAFHNSVPLHDGFTPP